LPRELTSKESGDGELPAWSQVSQIDADSIDSLDDLQRAHIVSVLEREHGNKARAARALGIHRRKLYRLLERYGIGSGG
jgi:DNA-binding NtrC family response regulator